MAGAKAARNVSLILEVVILASERMYNENLLKYLGDRGEVLR